MNDDIVVLKSFRQQRAATCQSLLAVAHFRQRVISSPAQAAPDRQILLRGMLLVMLLCWASGYMAKRHAEDDDASEVKADAGWSRRSVS